LPAGHTVTNRTDPSKDASLVVRTRSIEDVDALAAAMADGLDVEYVQLETKPFAARWTVIPLPETVLQFSRADVALARRIRIPDGTCAFLVPLVVPESARWNARPVSGNELIVCAPGSESYACDPGGTEFAIISVPARSTPAALAHAFLNGGTRECTLLPRARDAQTLQRRLRTALESTALDAGAVAVLNDIRGALEACLRHAVLSERRGKTSAGRSRIVRRAEEFFRTHVGEPVSMAQLSSNAMVSERCLREAFYDTYATSPMRYLRLWQLHQVRRALRSPDGCHATVTDIATFHGFYELGRFAGEYKALFGEVPSQTLSRARRQESTANVATMQPIVRRPASHAGIAFDHAHAAAGARWHPSVMRTSPGRLDHRHGD
jgi:AraC family transcriptional regulator, ethanolamine operon transcriptional activator